MNLSKISSNQQPLGKLLRLPLKLIPKRAVFRIMQGRLKGWKWIVGSGEHGYWLGWYEISKRQAFETAIPEGAVVYDIGANVGYYSLMAAVVSGPKGHVYAFEPLPRNVDYLRKHVTLNKMTDRITVFDVAVSDKTGEAAFDLGASTSMGHLAETGGIKVKQVRLDDMVASGEIKAPDYMKVDVEGAEYDVLNGARALLAQYKPVIFLDTHNREAHNATVKLLNELDYEIYCLDGKPLPESKELIASPKNRGEN
ncbi:MAG: FkbM family methyltransferase [Anaerolineaceae bacterium]|jgi:FkbM family methyltransferase|nr:FkbM family methyltransferase [Anaerolineaceae bacterium]